MKQSLKFLAYGLLCSGLLFSSCKKKDDVSVTDADSVALASNADDEATVNNEHEEALNDVDQIFNTGGLAGGRVDLNPICGATIDSSVAGQRTITFDGQTRCGNRQVIRSGSIVVKLYNAQRWRDAGAVLGVTFNEYTVKKGMGNSFGNAVTLNGTGKIYNVDGGLRKLIGNGYDHVTHRIRFAGTRVGYKGHTFTSWNIAKTRTYSATGDLYSISVKGDTNTSLNGAGNVGSWGTGRYGETVFTHFLVPIQANSSCGFAAPTAGKKFHDGLRRDLTVTFGVDASGNPVSSGCAYGYMYEYVGPRRTVTGIVAY